MPLLTLALKDLSECMLKEYFIYNVDLGTTDGHVQGYSRPAIVIKALNELNMCIIIPLTSKIESQRLPYTVLIKKAHSTNLKEDSVALVFQLRSIDNKIIGNEIGKLEEYQIGKIKAMMKEMFAV